LRKRYFSSDVCDIVSESKLKKRASFWPERVENPWPGTVFPLQGVKDKVNASLSPQGERHPGLITPT
jgi:hypothetical protein